MKSNFSINLLRAILVVLFCTTNFAFAQNNIPVAEIKTIAVKFLLAMFGVFLFSILTFVGLSLYNKFFVAAQVKDFKLSRNSLRTPKDIDEAIMLFITKNRLK